MSGCAGRMFKAYAASTFTKEASPAVPRDRRIGHLVEKGSSVVLHVELFDPGGWLTFDDERCDDVVVEVPQAALQRLPATVENPVAYLKVCSCVWAICTEQRAEVGFVAIQSRTQLGVRARLALEFPERKFDLAGGFRFGAPRRHLLPASVRP